MLGGFYGHCLLIASRIREWLCECTLCNFYVSLRLFQNKRIFKYFQGICTFQHYFMALW
jgi:hypothetical protein